VGHFQFPHLLVSKRFSFKFFQTLQFSIHALLQLRRFFFKFFQALQFTTQALNQSLPSMPHVTSSLSKVLVPRQWGPFIDHFQFLRLIVLRRFSFKCFQALQFTAQALQQITDIHAVQLHMPSSSSHGHVVSHTNVPPSPSDERVGTRDQRSTIAFQWTHQSCSKNTAHACAIRSAAHQDNQQD
jgi:hypothetical protein